MMRGVLLLATLAVGCRSADPVTLRLDPPLVDAVGASGLETKVSVEVVAADGRALGRFVLTPPDHVFDVRLAPDGSVVAWRASEDEVYVARFAASGAQRCRGTLGGAPQRRGTLEFVGPQLVHHWSAGTFLAEMEIIDPGCQRIAASSAAAITVSPSRRFAVAYTPRDAPRGTAGPLVGFDLERAARLALPSDLVGRVAAVRWSQASVTLDVVTSSGETASKTATLTALPPLGSPPSH